MKGRSRVTKPQILIFVAYNGGKIGIRILAARSRSVVAAQPVKGCHSLPLRSKPIDRNKKEHLAVFFLSWRKDRDSDSRGTKPLGRRGSDSLLKAVIHYRSVRNPSIETKKNTLWCSFYLGGKIGIRTLVGVLAQTRFPVVRLRPAQPSFHRVVFYHKNFIKSREIFRFARKNK